MSAIARPRSDSKLDALDVDQQRQLCEWLLTPGLSYERIKKLVLDEFNTSTLASSLSRFYQSYVSAYLIQRRAQAVGVAKEVGAEVRKAPGEFSDVTIDALEQKAFELANNPQVDAKAVKTVFSLLLKARDQELTKRKIDLLEKKASEAKETAESSKLSDAEKASRIREIFKKSEPGQAE